jgi:heterotetrameric sarcosine oxidase gamma subunit
VVERSPIARSPLKQMPPVTMVAGWEVSARQSTSLLRLIDCTPYTKILVRAGMTSPWAQTLGVGRGRVMSRSGALIAGIGYEEWLLLTPPGEPPYSLAAETGNGAMPLTKVDITHARAMIRITGTDSAKVLSKLCGIDFRDAATPDDTALRSSVARIVTEIMRHDAVQSTAASEQSPAAASRSYLLLCDRSAGQYLFDSLLDAGREYGIEVDGLADIGNNKPKSVFA